MFVTKILFNKAKNVIKKHAEHIFILVNIHLQVLELT